MENIEKKLEHSLNKVETLFSERYYNVKFNHKTVNDCVAKAIFEENGFRFEFAKMVLTTQEDRKDLFDRDDEIIEFYDKNESIFFKINQCDEFKFILSFSGYSAIKGLIKEFTTNKIVLNEKKYFRAIILTKGKFGVSSYFFPSKSLKVKDTIYGSGLVEVKIKNLNLHLFGFDDKTTNRNYFIIESAEHTNYEFFINLIDEIILSISFLTGCFLGNKAFILSSENEEFFNNDILSVKSFYEDLKNGYPVIPERHFQTECGILDNIINASIISGLVDKILDNLVYKRTILLLCQAHSEPYYVKATLYSVALETISNIVHETIESKNKPIQDKELAKKIRLELLDTLDKHKKEISKVAFEKFTNDINRLNSITNKQKLFLPFLHYGIRLPQKDLNAIENRNDFLHGRIPENIDKHFLPITVLRLLFCVNLLVLKLIGFKGCLYYQPVIYQNNNKLSIEESPLRRI